MPLVAEVSYDCLEQVYYCSWAVPEGWLVDPGANWVWRFHRDVKAWIRDPKVFMDRGMPMPDGQPPLLKERRHVPTEDAETIWRNLKSTVWIGAYKRGRE